LVLSYSHEYAACQDLHSFPTRRSSDLVSERNAEAEMAPRRRAHQSFDGMKTVLSQNLADQHGPKQRLGRNLRLPPAVPRRLQIALQPKTPRQIIPGRRGVGNAKIEIGRAHV